MNFSNKIFTFVILLVLFTSIPISANNTSFENDSSINLETNLEPILIDLEEMNLSQFTTTNLEDNSSNYTENFTENNISLIHLNLTEQNITFTKKTKNNDEEVISSSSLIQEELNNDEQEMISIALYKDGKKEIEGEIPENFNGEIEKTELIIDDEKKEVIVKSETHLESPLLVYTNIVETKNEEDISLYWKTENKEIEIENYFDENNNGLIDRISWIVPHLSEQIFEITVIPSNIISEDFSEINLSVNGLSGTLTNPISFVLNVNYPNLENLSCIININNDTQRSIYLDEETIFDDVDLPNGNHNWVVYCKNKENSSINKTINGIFTIQENIFGIIGINPVYINDKDISFAVTSPGNEEFSSRLYTPSGGIVNQIQNSTVIYKNSIIAPGTYTLQLTNGYYEQPIYKNSTFYVAHAEIITNKSTASINEPIKITLILNSPTKQISYIKLDTNDGNINNNYYTTTKTVENVEITHLFSQAGIYQPILNFTIEGTSFSVKSPIITVSDPSTNNSAPTVDLIYPKGNQVIKDTKITFKYKPNDDKKITSCTYELYKKDGSWKELDYTSTNSSIILNKEVEIKLADFEDGEYSWYILCKDNQSKETTKSEDFIVQTTDYEQEEEVLQAIDDLNNFLKQENTWSLEEKTTLEELGITEELNYYAKRLVQIDQDLGNNLKFVSDANLRAKRTDETLNELEEIIENIPVEIKIIDSTEYIKNSFTANMEEITKKYTESKNMKLTPKEINKLAEENVFLQESLSTSTKIKKVEIKYQNKKKNIISITKEINLMNNHNTILEEIPEKFESIQFKTTSEEISQNLFEINVENIEESKIIYYIEGDFDLNELKETETVIFEEAPASNIGITGYFSAPLSGKNKTLYYFLFTIFLFAAIYFGRDFIQRIQLNIWRREENVRRILDYSEKAKKSLLSEDTEIAKEYYHKIKEIYALVPEGFKDYIYQTIKKIRIGIDKTDMMNFVKEYEISKKEKRIEDSKRIYKNIQEQYKKLPQKYQEKVYERVIKDTINNEFKF